MASDRDVAHELYHQHEGVVSPEMYVAAGRADQCKHGSEVCEPCAFDRGRAEGVDSVKTRELDIVFDGPPSNESGRFVECEMPPNTSVNIGEWIKRDDGYWVLRIPVLAAKGADDD
jgi:hypothetical protein